VSCYLGLQLPMLRLHSPQHRPRRVLVRMTRDLCDTCRCVLEVLQMKAGNASSTLLGLAHTVEVL
jgi:hypothetical protein